MIQRIKGTQDWLDLTLFNFCIERIAKHLACYNFTQIRTPILEPIELFKRSLGQATDVVSKEMFLVKGTSESELICLRPEVTASTVRAFIENDVLDVPWRVFSWGSMFRYERPQKGRFREFNQVTIENIGASSISHDVQLITMLDRLFHEELKLDNYALMINFLGSYEDRATYKELLKTFLDASAASICQTCNVRKDLNIMRVFDCKNPECQQIYSSAPKMIDHLSKESVLEWQQLQDQLSLLSVSFVVNPMLVRGLDYYNKTVFEFMSNDLGAQNTFCGGGRYDSLVKDLGGKQSQPSLGAAIGVERLLLLLDPIKDRLLLPEKPALTVIIPIAQEQIPLALLLADELYAHNKCAEVLLDGGSIKSMMRRANKMGATYAVLIGEDEQQAHEVTIKQMIAGSEERIKQIDLVSYIR
jgi:histidyl-tRNA synthetase